MTFLDFWCYNGVTEIFVAGNGCPFGQTFKHNIETDIDEDYCDLGELIGEGGGLFSNGTDVDGLEGRVEGGVWTWNGKGRAKDCYGNDYHQIKMYT